MKKSTRHIFVFLAAMFFAFAAGAQAPATFHGAAIFQTITSGDGTTFDTSGYTLVIPANNANTYQRFDLTTGASANGSFTYSQAAADALLTVSDGVAGVFAADYTFSDSTMGSFAFNQSSSGAFQNGNFIYYSGTAPGSLAGKTIAFNISDGGGGADASGTETISFTASGYTLTDISGIHVGTYTYSLVNKSTGKVAVSGGSGSGSLYLSFTDPANGGFAARKSNGHWQIGIINIPDTTPPVVTFTTPTPNQLWSNDMITVTGKASDDVGVSDVMVSSDGLNWIDTTSTSNSFANWTSIMDVTLVPGTNTIYAVALDTSGNYKTNSTKVIYILSAPLTVGTNGLGSISPSLNGALLQIGRNYTLTATPAVGFAFANWTDGGTYITNSPALTFTMRSNLTLVAHFADSAKPIASLINLGSGYTVSNSTFTIQGKASDNVAVSYVLYQLNTNDVQLADPNPTNNSYTNWSAVLNLIPGTNTFRFSAFDAANNSSSGGFQFVYVVSAQITISTNGKGSISPAVNGAMLQIGKNYTLTATPAVGFVFTNWTDGSSSITNKPALTFMMASNLSFTANFVDITRPTVSITNIPVGGNVSNEQFTVRGKAADNLMLTNVFYNLNNNGWLPTTPVNADNFTNWFADLDLNPGTNSISAYSVDSTGNFSLTNTVKVVYILSAQITVSTNGKGSISPAVNGALLQIGKNYTLTATPAAGFVFTNWTDVSSTIITNKPALTFMMASNLFFTANFVDVQKPTVAITNIPASGNVSNEVFTVRGKTGDNVAVTNVFYNLNHNGWNAASLTNQSSSWSANLSLIQGTNILSVYAVDTSGLISQPTTVAIVRMTPPSVFPIFQNGSFKNPQAQIAFDGNNYLVVFQDHNTDNSGIPSAQLVSRFGTLAAPLLQIPVVGGADPPQVAFDGNNYLMAWSDSFNQIEGSGIHGEFIDTSGAGTGNRFQINQSTTIDNFGTMVFGSGVYFMTWSDSRDASTNGGNDDIFGAMVTTSGTLAVSDFEISKNASQDLAGQGTAGYDGTNFLATWGGAAGRYSVSGRLVSPSGNFVTDPFIIYTNSSLPAGKALECVAFDGTKYLVLFTVGAGSGAASNWHIYGRFVTPAGEVLTNQISITTDAGPQIVPCATFDGTRYLITWNQGFNPFSAAASSGSIKARFFNINGSPTSAEFNLFTPTANQTALWAPVLFDGSQYFSVGGFGSVLNPAPDLKFTNGVIRGAILPP